LGLTAGWDRVADHASARIGEQGRPAADVKHREPRRIARPRILSKGQTDCVARGGFSPLTNIRCVRRASVRHISVAGAQLCSDIAQSRLFLHRFHLHCAAAVDKLFPMHLVRAPSCKRRGFGGRHDGKSTPQDLAG
jgi:hypothetical protein